MSGDWLGSSEQLPVPNYCGKVCCSADLMIATKYEPRFLDIYIISSVRLPSLLSSIFKQSVLILMISLEKNEFGWRKILIIWSAFLLITTTVILHFKSAFANGQWGDKYRVCRVKFWVESVRGCRRNFSPIIVGSTEGWRLTPWLAANRLMFGARYDSYADEGFLKAPVWFQITLTRKTFVRLVKY